MRSRRGNVVPDLVGGLAATLFILSLAAVATQTHRQDRQQAAQSADIERMQNLLAAVRHGASPVLPQGWSLHRTPAVAGTTVVEIAAPGLRLRTLIRATP